MPKRIKQRRPPNDVRRIAQYHFVDVSPTGDGSIAPPTKAQISAFMSELGRKGGKIGGKRRMQTMTAKQRRAVAMKAARARWHGDQKS